MLCVKLCVLIAIFMMYVYVIGLFEFLMFLMCVALVQELGWAWPVGWEGAVLQELPPELEDELQELPPEQEWRV